MTDVGGLGGIRWEDQEKIRAKVEIVTKEATDGPSSSAGLVKLIYMYYIILFINVRTKRSKSKGGKQPKKLKEDPQQKALRVSACDMCHCIVLL